MEIQQRSELVLENKSEKTNIARLNLDLNVQDLLKAEEDKEIAETLEASQEQIKSNIFNLVRKQVLPVVVNESSDGSENEKANESKSSIDISVENRTEAQSYLNEGKLDLAAIVDMLVQMDSVDSIESIKAFEQSIDVIASNIAETIYFNLENIYLGKQEFHVESSWNESKFHSTDAAA